MDRHPLIVAPETPLVEVLELMSQSYIRSCRLDEHDAAKTLVNSVHTSSALVMKEKQLLGIFTEQDIVRLIALERLLSGMTIADVMTRQAIALKASDFQNVFTTLSLLRRYQIRHLPILDDGDAVLGMVTEESVRQVLQPLDLLKFRRVGEVMNTTAIHAPPTASLLHLAQLMTQHRVSCVVIAFGSQLPQTSNLKPVGIITERDLVQFRLLELNLDESKRKR